MESAGDYLSVQFWARSAKHELHWFHPEHIHVIAAGQHEQLVGWRFARQHLAQLLCQMFFVNGGRA